MSVSKRIVEKLRHPHKITLYMEGNKPNIYYYFRYKKKTYRGSTGQNNLELSIDVVSDIFTKVKLGITEEKRKIITFQEVVKEFIDFNKKKIENKKLTQKTFDEYERQSGYLTQCFGKRDIEEFGGEDKHLEYQKWRSVYYNNPKNIDRQIYTRQGKVITGRTLNKKVGVVSIDKECQLLVSILKFGNRKLNVLQGKTIQTYEKLGKLNKRDILTKDEYKKLETYWMNKNPYYWKIMRFINNTGLRFPSEVMNLRWKDIDLTNNRMTIRDRKRIGTQTIPLVGRGKEIIQSLQNRTGIGYSPDDYVWVDDRGKRITNLTKPFKKSLLVCGINKHITMYSFRHLYTTRMVKRPDISLKIISEVLGHKSLDMIERHYSHLRIDDMISSVSQSEENREKLVKEQQERLLKEMEEEMKKMNGEVED